MPALKFSNPTNADLSSKQHRETFTEKKYLKKRKKNYNNKNRCVLNEALDSL